MTLTMTFGGSPVALPREQDPFESEYIPFGASHRMYDATLRVQVTGLRWRVRISWEGLTQTERNTLFTVYGNYLTTAGALVFPDGLSISMMTGMGSWSESVWFDPRTEAPYYDVGFTVEQV